MILEDHFCCRSPSVPTHREPCTLSRKGPIFRLRRHLSLWIAFLLRRLLIQPPGRRALWAHPTIWRRSQQDTMVESGRYKWCSSPFVLGCVVLVTRWVTYLWHIYEPASHLFLLQDRRPITPPPCIRLIVQDEQTGKEIDIKYASPGRTWSGR